MNILLYATPETESGRRLKQAIEGLEVLESLTDCWNLGDLLGYLHTPAPLPETVVLQASNPAELARIEPFCSRLEQVFFILVLPDDQVETVACGYRLRPRLIVYQDSDFTEVGAVLGRLESRICRTFEGFSSIGPHLSDDDNPTLKQEGSVL